MEGQSTGGRRARGDEAIERTLFVGITAFRWAAWGWMAVTFAVDARTSSPGTVEAVAHTGVGWALILAALAYTAWTTAAVRREPERLDAAAPVAVDLLLAVALVALDPWVYQSPHAQHLGGNWAIASVLSAGVVFAGPGGLAAGASVGIARYLGLVLWEPGPWHGDDTLASLSAIVVYALGGGVAGFFAMRLRRAEREVTAARARDEVARTLHDGVLQTLAVIQRRSTDDELVALAREQERDLRRFLFGVDRPVDDLLARLRDVTARFERTHGCRAELVVAGDLPRVVPPVAEACVGAATEALTNAAKHGHASRVVVFVEPTDDGGLFCSVKDDGRGFDVDSTPPGVGLEQSIRARVHEVGGASEVVSRPGRGTEVRLHLPG